VAELSQQPSPIMINSSATTTITTAVALDNHQEKKTPSPKLTVNTSTNNVRLKSAPLNANDILKDLMESMQGYTVSWMKHTKRAFI
jgi:hypothetical protein